MIDCAGILKVLGDPTRLRVIEALLDGPKHVGEINKSLGVGPSLLSHHLRVLRTAKLIAATRDGKAVLYRIAPGVEVGRVGKTLELGCCRLSFH